MSIYIWHLFFSFIECYYRLLVCLPVNTINQEIWNLKLNFVADLLSFKALVRFSKKKLSI